MFKRSTQSVEMAAKCVSCNGRYTGICAAMSTEELVFVGHQTTRRLIPADTPLFFEGDHIRVHTNIVKGVVHLSKVMADGRQQIVALQFAPTHLSARSSQVTAKAVTECEICLIPASLMKNVISRNQQVKTAMFKQTLADLDESRSWMLLIGRKTALEKVASLLLMIVLRGDTAAHDGYHFDIPLTRADMADFLGLTVETVSRQITKLRALQIVQIENGRSVRVLSMQRLKELSNN